MKGGNMVPTLVGIVVIQLLERHFPDFVDSHFTSKMEATLDSIAKGSVVRGRYGRIDALLSPLYSVMRFYWNWSSQTRVTRNVSC